MSRNHHHYGPQDGNCQVHGHGCGEADFVSGEYGTAGLCCSRLLEYPGPEKEEGKALLREIRSRMDRRGGGGSSSSRGVVGAASSRRSRTGASDGARAGRVSAGGRLGTNDESAMDVSGAAPDSSFDFSP